ncbi:MAG: 30S ribosomal protein S19 [Candidatus Pacearchaeota archaeon]
MVKEFVYRGKGIEELKQMDLREFAKLLPSREKRTLLRQTEKVEKFLKRCEKKISMNKGIRTHSRSMIIVPKMIGLTINIHNGKEFVAIKITEEMLGHRLGEFALTRRKVEHGAPGIGATRSSAFLSVK